MKSAKTLIKHIYNDPSYKKLRSMRECSLLLKSLRPELRHYVAFCSVKNECLCFTLTHPAGKTELNNDSSISEIKCLLKILNLKAKKDMQISIFENIQKIDFKLLRKDQIYKIAEEKTAKIIKRTRAKGDFINSCKDKKLRIKFEELRVLLKANFVTR
ncbi:MAG: hypothetical protein K5978_01145 [Campylobacter sp.]|nr:hypothetical protein [Campylobacter sp.]